VLLLLNNDRLKLKQCQMMYKTKMTNCFKFKQNTTAYWFVYLLKKYLMVGTYDYMLQLLI